MQITRGVGSLLDRLRENFPDLSSLLLINRNPEFNKIIIKPKLLKNKEDIKCFLCFFQTFAPPETFQFEFLNRHDDQQTSLGETFLVQQLDLTYSKSQQRLQTLGNHPGRYTLNLEGFQFHCLNATDDQDTSMNLYQVLFIFGILGFGVFYLGGGRLDLRERFYRNMCTSIDYNITT